MTSGNFIIGEDLSLKGFNNCIKPNLEKYKVQITDFMSFKGLNPRNNNRILLSLIGNNESLEEIVKKSMKEAYNSVVKEEKEKNYKELVVWPQQLYQYGRGLIFETLGLYIDDKTASKVYQNLAIKYSLIEIDNVLKEFEDKMSDFAKKFK